MDLKNLIFRLKNIDLGVKFGKSYKYGPKNHHFRIINMDQVSEASAAHPSGASLRYLVCKATYENEISKYCAFYRPASQYSQYLNTATRRMSCERI